MRVESHIQLEDVIIYHQDKHGIAIDRGNLRRRPVEMGTDEEVTMGRRFHATNAATDGHESEGVGGNV